MSDRIEQIKAMLEKEPDDSFLHYSLAMEYVSAGEHHLAAEAFGACLVVEPDNLPARVECAKALRTWGKLSEARAMFTEAMQIAVAKGDTHVGDYVRQQLEALGG